MSDLGGNLKEILKTVRFCRRKRYYFKKSNP